MVDTSDEWIFTRTGIRERRIAAEGEFTSHMATHAAERALEQAGLAAGGSRTHHHRHHHPGHAHPGDGLLCPATARRVPRGGLRYFRRVLGISLRDENLQAPDFRWRLQQRAHHRRGKTLVDHQLGGSLDLRVVRRWRRGRRLAPRPTRRRRDCRDGNGHRRQSHAPAGGSRRRNGLPDHPAATSTTTSIRSTCRARRFSRSPSTA